MPNLHATQYADAEASSAPAFKVGLIRVITLDDRNDVELHGRLIESLYPGIEIESRCIPDQPEGIHSPALEKLAEPKIVETARSFADKDMILVSCADDPALPLVRAALPGMPVTGAGECACALAMRFGRTIGVIGITDTPPKAYGRMLTPVYDPHAAMAPGILLGNFRPDGVHGTLDLQTPEGRDSVIRTAMRIKELGADVIALGCTGLATIGIADELAEATGLPIIDPVLAMGAFASFEAAAKRRRAAKN